jgi:hypothetical protein
MHSRRGATLADAVGHGQGRGQSTVTDWRACRFIVIGIAPFAAHPPTKGRWVTLSPLDGVQAFVKVCFSFSSLPSSANIHFTSASIYRAALDSPASSRSFQSHILYSLGQSTYKTL